MHVPLSWLREFTPVEAEPEEIAERLSMGAFEVEQVRRIGAGLDAIVVAEVLAMREHPDADNLMLVQVSDGTAERPIVCGARNYSVGDRVPLARPGARLPGGMEIAARTIRGERSEGMLCSSRELDLADDHSGILILDRDATVGSRLDVDDVVLELAITPNRPDALSVAGVAREIAALFGTPFAIPSPSVTESDDDVNDLASVEVADARGCPRYLARVVRGLAVGRSPWWMRRRLMAAGVRPISNVVDVTNFVLLERGQPLHAFDLGLLRDGAIVVRTRRKGESITTLDGSERTLDRNDVLICNAERPIAIAGIMGGAETEVSQGTTDILLESATFAAMRIARTAARLRMRTEASIRFERGADPELPPAAADRACELLAQVAGGRVARGAIDVYPKAVTRKPIRIRAARANALIGIEQSVEEMAATLRAIGCEVEATTTTIKATPPTWRPDVTIAEDLVEELARLYGYDRVPETLPAGSRTGGLTEPQARRRRIADLLAEGGLFEVQTLSTLPLNALEPLGIDDDHPWRATPRIANPLSDEEALLRPTLLVGLLTTAQRNAHRRVLPVTIYETGVVFAGAVDETERVAWLLTGHAPSGWHAPERPLDVFDASGVLERLAAGLDRTLDLTPDEDPPMPWHPGRCATVLLDGAAIGRVGELHPRVGAAYDLPERVAVAEIDAAPLLHARGGAAAPIIPRFPSVERDVAVIVPDHVPAREVASTITKAAGPLLGSIELFDVYRGEPIPSEKVSLAYALSFRDPERTLTDEDADAAMRAIVEAVSAAGWTVRD